MDAAGVKSEEEISEHFVCCVCLDLLYKPIVLSCGHISCFWCVHRSMNGLRESHCPICRNPYHYFPNICQMLHFLLQKMYPVAYNRRESQILEEEEKLGHFSPQLGDANACSSQAKQGSHCLANSTFEESSANAEQSEADSRVNSCMATSEEASNANAQVTGTATDNQKVSGFCKLVTAEDVLCAVCKELLFRPVVLNCGHVYCESCLIHLCDKMIRCKVCPSSHPKGFPKVSLQLVQFLEEHFPKEYALRRDSVQLKQVDFKGLTEADNQADNAQVLADPESRFHFGVGCDFCGMYPIFGDRYKCEDCVESMGFDLCSDCYNTSSNLPGRFNQRHTPEHKFVLEQSSAFPYWRFGGAIGHILDNTTALVTGIYSSEDSEDGSTPLTVTDGSQESVENSVVTSDSSPGSGQDQDDSQPTT